MVLRSFIAAPTIYMYSHIHSVAHCAHRGGASGVW